MKTKSDFRTIKVEGFKISFHNRREFEKIYNEVFVDQQYNFEYASQSPFIIDCGAHIGLSILYFKSLYPRAHILAFEPDPLNLELLATNVQQNNLEDVRVIPCAVGSRDEQVFLYREPSDLYEANNGIRWTWANRISADTNKKLEAFPIQVVRLSNFINHYVDFLKVDIEGIEQLVVQEISQKLNFVRNMVVEYHGHNTSLQINDLEIICTILKEAGFLLNTRPKDVVEHRHKIRENDLRDRLVLLTGVKSSVS
jgi:FkbM family methyltransferase